jgi:hypothetical protein
MIMKYLKYSAVFYKLNNKDSFSEYDYILLKKTVFII